MPEQDLNIARARIGDAAHALERAAILAERERCARLAEEIGARGWGSNAEGYRGYVATVAAAIREGE